MSFYMDAELNARLLQAICRLLIGIAIEDLTPQEKEIVSLLVLRGMIEVKPNCEGCSLVNN